MTYGYGKRIASTFDAARETVKEELSREGFGVLSEIDVRAKLLEKVGADVGNYVILGACNPPLAHRALLSEREVGLLLPCNVILYGADGDVTVSAVMPSAAMSFIDNAELREVGAEAERKLRDVVDRCGEDERKN